MSTIYYYYYYFASHNIHWYLSSYWLIGILFSSWQILSYKGLSLMGCGQFFALPMEKNQFAANGHFPFAGRGETRKKEKNIIAKNHRETLSMN